MTTSLTLGSLFDRIGGFPLAGVRQGYTPVWASEIETFPIEVTKIRFPNMLHVGDIMRLKGSELTPVDVVCGGSPCQDLSVANGRRLGLQGERSGLFMEQIRVIREMRAYDKANGSTETWGRRHGDVSSVHFAKWTNETSPCRYRYNKQRACREAKHTAIYGFKNNKWRKSRYPFN